MDRRLLIGVLAVMLGGYMSKRATRQWLVVGEFIGGPADGGRTEFGVEGPDPVRAFVVATERGDVPERLQVYGHWYEVRKMRLKEADAGEAGKYATVPYVHDGMRE